MRAKHFSVVKQQYYLGLRFGTSKGHLRPPSHSGLGYRPFLGGDFVVVDSSLIVSHIDYGGSVFGPCFVIQCLCPSSFAILLVGKRELVALL